MEVYCARVNGMIQSGVFEDIGRGTVHLDGSAWGVWHGPLMAVANTAVGQSDLFKSDLFRPGALDLGQFHLGQFDLAFFRIRQDLFDLGQNFLPSPAASPFLRGHVPLRPVLLRPMLLWPMPIRPIMSITSAKNCNCIYNSDCNFNYQ